MQEKKLDHISDTLLDGPDEQLGYLILGVDYISGEDDYNTINGQDWQTNEKLMGNTHACWGFFPVVN